MATLTPPSASLRAIPLPMPREDPVISACLVVWAMSTSLSAPLGVSGKGPSPRGNPGGNLRPGPLLAATMRRRVAVVNRDFRYGPTAATREGLHGAARPAWLARQHNDEHALAGRCRRGSGLTFQHSPLAEGRSP